MAQNPSQQFSEEIETISDILANVVHFADSLAARFNITFSVTHTCDH